MCYYIAAFIPPKADINIINQIAKRFEFSFKNFNNKYLQQQLLSEEQLLLKSSADHCECETCLGVALRDDERKDNFEKDKLKLQKKGWTENKIRRWLNNKEKRYIKPHNEQAASNWICFLKAIKDNSSYFGILLHWYHGDIETESILIKEIRYMKPAELNTEVIFHIEEDILYRFE